MKILVIEDNQRVSGFIRRGLEELGHTVELAGTGPQGLKLAMHNAYDVLVIDRMLPGGLDGLSVIEALHNAGRHVPALVLSALSGVEARIEGLRRGGDDYLVKPFSLEELLARLEALVRRTGVSSEPTHLDVGDLHADLLTRAVRRGKRAVLLQPREFKLLEFLMRHSGQVVTRDMLLNHVWEHQSDPHSNVIDVHISKLRQKIDWEFEPPLLRTVRRSGYILSVPGAS